MILKKRTLPGYITLFTSVVRDVQAVNARFMQGMINRLIFGYYIYEQGQDVTKRNFLKRARKALDRYAETRNKEALMDAANYCMREFDHPSIPGTYEASVDSHGRRQKDD